MYTIPVYLSANKMLGTLKQLHILKTKGGISLKSDYSPL